MSRARVIVLTLQAMTAFAANSLLCRLALKHAAIDVASFAAVRIVAAPWELGRAAISDPQRKWATTIEPLGSRQSPTEIRFRTAMPSMSNRA
jgi:hypothetical protein